MGALVQALLLALLLVYPVGALACPRAPALGEVRWCKGLGLCQPRRGVSMPLIIGSSEASSCFPRSVLMVAGGAVDAVWVNSPQRLFDRALVALLASTALLRLGTQHRARASKHVPEGASTEQRSLQRRYLTVFWLLRLADWLQGPYFYEVYRTKVLGGQRASLELVTKLFLAGFATTGLAGVWVGRAVDAVGRRAGCLLCALLYALSALSTRSDRLAMLMLGRVAGGLGTSLLASAPESWLVSEFRALPNGRPADLAQLFGWAYAGDSIVAIGAGLVASTVARQFGPTGPFTASVGVLALAALAMLLSWSENTAVSASPSSQPARSSEAAKSTLTESESVWRDWRIWSLGATQALFEGAMFVFVLQWAPLMQAALSAGGDAGVAPFGKVFSCFMAACLLGSSLFGSLGGVASAEALTSAAAAVAAAALMAGRRWGLHSAPALCAAFVTFEVCVGVYFPCASTLRARYLPDSHRSLVMSAYGVPLNVFVVAVSLGIRRLGSAGALAAAGVALCASSLAAATLARYPQVKQGGQSVGK